MTMLSSVAVLVAVAVRSKYIKSIIPVLVHLDGQITRASSGNAAVLALN